MQKLWLGLGGKAAACRAAPQNLLDFAFKRDKIKPKQKDFGYCVAEKQFRVRPALSIAESLYTIIRTLRLMVSRLPSNKLY